MYYIIDYVFGTAIDIAHGNPNGGDEDGRDGVCRAAKLGGYCVVKLPPPIAPLVWDRVSQVPNKASNAGLVEPNQS